LDGTNTAAFGHHFSLVLTDGAARRGLALAAAGRSACLSPDAIGSSLASRRNSQLSRHRRCVAGVLDKTFKGHQNINGIYEVLGTDYGLQPITDIKKCKLQTRKFWLGYISS
jgi:hypothetical protein